MQDEVQRILSQVAHKHWWLAGRRDILRALLDKYRPGVNGKVLDAGCGPGVNLSLLAEYGQVTGLDSSPLAVQLCRESYPFPVIKASVESMPYPEGYFQLVAAFDLLEHVPDDNLLLQELHRVCAPGGRVILTVPANPWLWSDHDVALGHYRRYRLQELQSKITGSGFRLIKASHFNTLLLPMVVLQRLIGKIRTRLWTKATPLHPESDLKPTYPLLNKLLYSIFSLERRFITSASFPVGLSIVAVLEK